MPYRRRSGLKKASISFIKGFGVAAVVLVAVVTGLFVLSFLTKEKVVSQRAQIKSAMAEIQEPADANSEISGKYFGLCKKKSIHSVEDFRKAVLNDTVLSAHFSGFNWAAAKLGKQDKDIWTFVSYRKGELIRRTLKPVKLPKGDGYITDGVRIVRTFCCNDYSIAPRPMEIGMVSPPAPIERVDGPPRRMIKNSEHVDDPLRQLSSGSSAEESTDAIVESLRKIPDYSASPQFYGGSIQYPYSSPKIKPTAIITPEPNTLLLIGTGMAIFSLFRLLRRKRAN